MTVKDPKLSNSDVVIVVIDVPGYDMTFIVDVKPPSPELSASTPDPIESDQGSVIQPFNFKDISETVANEIGYSDDNV